MLIVAIYLDRRSLSQLATIVRLSGQALLGTTLAPIAGQFGWQWGMVAGFLLSSAALTVGFKDAGLNLYNNGFAAGIVAAVIVPVILIFV